MVEEEAAAAVEHASSRSTVELGVRADPTVIIALDLTDFLLVLT